MKVPLFVVSIILSSISFTPALAVSSRTLECNHAGQPQGSAIKIRSLLLSDGYEGVDLTIGDPLLLRAIAKQLGGSTIDGYDQFHFSAGGGCQFSNKVAGGIFLQCRPNRYSMFQLTSMKTGEPPNILGGSDDYDPDLLLVSYDADLTGKVRFLWEVNLLVEGPEHLTIGKYTVRIAQVFAPTECTIIDK